MMITALLAATISFTATATGVEKGSAVEFIFAGANTDRDYESMFLIDGGISNLCSRLEKAGLPRGKPTDATKCIMWPVGCKVSFAPAIDTYVDISMPEGVSLGSLVYTGGARDADNTLVADSIMPASFLSTYTLAQSPIVYDTVQDQGVVYGAFTAREKLEKGEKVTFNLSWDSNSFPKHIDFTAKQGNMSELIRLLKAESEKGPVETTVLFDGELTVSEATALAQSLAVIDSVKVKINGCAKLFYQAFLPMVKWLDRKERLQQPFELHLESGEEPKLVFIEEDWSVDGDDPKLTPKTISFAESSKYLKTDTCFIYASKGTKLSRIYDVMDRFDRMITNWYVFAE